MVDFIKNAWKIQNTFEERVFHLKNMVLNECGRYSFKKTDQILFFAIFLFCYFAGTIILLHVEFFHLYYTDYWMLPFGIGTVSLFFTMMCSEGDSYGNS